MVDLFAVRRGVSGSLVHLVLGLGLGLSLCLGIGLGGCSGSSSGSAAPSVDVTGTWRVFMTPDGSTTEIGPTVVRMTQTAATIDGASLSGSVSGNSISITSDGGSFVVAFSGTVTGDTAAGSFATTGSVTGTGTFRLERFVPSGAVTLAGTLLGVTLDVTSTAAVGSRDYADPAKTVLDQVEFVVMPDDIHVEVGIDVAGLTVGTLAVPGTVTVNVLYRDDTKAGEVAATGGSVTVTRFDGLGFAGSYTLTLPDGESLTGTFDVTWDLDSYAL